MRILKILLVLLLIYVGVVVLFETMLGVFQPEAGSSMVITTFDAEGTAHERVVSRLESDGRFYAAVNHWPRAWYRRVLENPSVRVEYGGEAGDYLVVRVTGVEFDRVSGEHPLSVVFRILTGFPRRHILRFDPA